MSNLQEILGLNSQVNFILGKPQGGKSIFLKTLAGSLILEAGPALHCVYRNYENQSPCFSKVLKDSQMTTVKVTNLKGPDNKIKPVDLIHPRDSKLYIFIDDIELLTASELVTVKEVVFYSRDTRVFATINGDYKKSGLIRKYADLIAINNGKGTKYSTVGVRRITDGPQTSFKANGHYFGAYEEDGSWHLKEIPKDSKGLIDHEAMYKGTEGLLNSLIEFNESTLLPCRETRIQDLNIDSSYNSTVFKEFCVLGLCVPRQCGKTTAAVKFLKLRPDVIIITKHDIGTNNYRVFNPDNYIEVSKVGVVTRPTGYVIIDDSSSYTKSELDEIFEAVFREGGYKATVILL